MLHDLELLSIRNPQWTTQYATASQPASESDDRGQFPTPNRWAGSTAIRGLNYIRNSVKVVVTCTTERSLFVMIKGSVLAAIGWHFRRIEDFGKYPRI